MRTLVPLFLAAAALCGATEVQAPAADADETPGGSPPERTGPLAFQLGEDWPELVIPRDEELVYSASVSAALIETTLGTVTLSTGVDPYRPGLLLPVATEQARAGQETGWLKARASGKHILYEMDAWIETRFLPQQWPRLKYYYEHRGTENRRREILIGVQNDLPIARYHGEREHRGWGDWRERRLPGEGAIETMGAIYLMRSMLAGGEDQIRFPMVTKLDLWTVTLARGEEQVVETAAGRFDAVKIELSTERHPMNPPADDAEEFQGLFGIQGTIDIWVHKPTGVPLRIVGDVPAGPIQVRAEMLLTSYRGTPEGFAPLPN